MLARGAAVTAAADPYLDTLTSRRSSATGRKDGTPRRRGRRHRHLRGACHYWYHLGESQAIRQMLGHRDLAAFVGNIKRALHAGSRMKHRAPAPRGLTPLSGRSLMGPG